MTAASQQRCRVCDGPSREHWRSGLPVCVTSSGIRVDRPAAVSRCDRCGLIQKSESELLTDYSVYELFDNNPVADKLIRKTGLAVRTRSEFIADLTVDRMPRTSNRVLEVGCHRGAFLSALRKRDQTIDAYGFDIDPRYARFIEPICGVGRYHHGELGDVAGPFDACVLIHSFEHIPNPIQVLRTIRENLSPAGVLVIVVPDIRANPSDAYTCDHTGHYTRDTLHETLSLAGFTGSVDDTEISNELVAVATPMENPTPTPTPTATFEALFLQTLLRFESGVKAFPLISGYVFGTTVVGSLLAAYLDNHVIGFTDESEFRIGRQFLGKPVVSPTALSGQHVFLGAAESVAEQVEPRFRSLGLITHNPWKLG